MSEHTIPRAAFARPLLDSLGQPIGPGDLVQYIPPYPLVFAVADVRTAVDPRMPPGSVLVTFQVTTQVAYRSGQPAANLVKVGTLASREDLARAPGTPDPASPPNVDLGTSGQAPGPDPGPTDPQVPQGPPGPRLVLTDPPQ